MGARIGLDPLLRKGVGQERRMFPSPARCGSVVAVRVEVVAVMVGVVSVVVAAGVERNGACGSARQVPQSRKAQASMQEGDTPSASGRVLGRDSVAIRSGGGVRGEANSAGPPSSMQEGDTPSANCSASGGSGCTVRSGSVSEAGGASAPPPWTPPRGLGADVDFVTRVREQRQLST